MAFPENREDRISLLRRIFESPRARIERLATKYGATFTGDTADLDVAAMAVGKAVDADAASDLANDALTPFPVYVPA